MVPADLLPEVPEVLLPDLAVVDLAEAFVLPVRLVLAERWERAVLLLSSSPDEDLDLELVDTFLDTEDPADERVVFDAARFAGFLVGVLVAISLIRLMI